MDHEVSIQGIERARRGANARLDPADLRGPGCNHSPRRSLAGSCPYAVVGTARSVAVEAGSNTSKGGHREGFKTNSPRSGSVIGGNICGRGDTSARPWARWMRRRSKSILRIRSGMRTTRGLSSPRPRSLEPALSRDTLQAALAAPRDFQSQLNPTALRRWLFSLLSCTKSADEPIITLLPQIESR